MMIGETLDANVRRHPKVSGSRFVGHKLNALKVFNNNLGVLIPFAENALASKDLLTDIMQAKVKGFYEKWTNFSFLSQAVIYQEVLCAVSKLSKFLEKDEAVICEVVDAFEECKDSLEDISKVTHSLPLLSHGSFECHLKPDNTAVLLASTSAAPSTVTTKNISKLTPVQKNKIMKTLNKSTLTIASTPIHHVSQGLQSGNIARQKLVPSVQVCIEDRFEPLSKNPVIQAMCTLTDFRVWDHEERTFGHEEIDIIGNYYALSLERHGYNADPAKEEWRSLKRIKKKKYDR